MGALIILILLQSRVVFSFGEHLFLPIIESPVYDVELKNDLIFSWQIDHDQEEIIVEIKHDISSRDDFRGRYPETLNYTYFVKKQFICNVLFPMLFRFFFFNQLLQKTFSILHLNIFQSATKISTNF